MKIDIARVNLLEKDIEDWLYENPDTIEAGSSVVSHWIGRQYRLPSGIADLVGITHHFMLVVVEIKNVAINKAAVTQVCRYAADLQDILLRRENYIFTRDDGEPLVWKVLVGPSIDDQTFGEAIACGISVVQFTPNLNLDFSRIHWSKEYRDRVREQIREISFREEWKAFGRHMDEVVDEMEQKEYDEQYRQEYLKTVPQKPDEADEYDALMDAVINKAIEDDEEEAPF